jgi:HSP20 family protein
MFSKGIPPFPNQEPFHMKNLTKSEPDTPAVAERVNYQLPAVNIYQTDDGYTLEADIPGVNRDGLEIHLDQNELTLVARRHASSDGTVHYRESADGDFRRVFELNPEIDTDKIAARVDQGVLTLHLPRREAVKPRKIAVTD